MIIILTIYVLAWNDKNFTEGVGVDGVWGVGLHTKVACDQEIDCMCIMNNKDALNKPATNASVSQGRQGIGV